MFLYLTKLGLKCVLPWVLWNPTFSSKTDNVTHIYAPFCKKCQILKLKKVSRSFDYDQLQKKPSSNIYFKKFFNHDQID